MPELVNFVVGAVLSDEDPAAAEGRARLDARLASGAGVTPLGMGRTPTYDAAAAPGGVFGQTPGLLCDYFVNQNGGRCTIWRYRPPPCSTWFCHHLNAAIGYRFWRSLQTLFYHLERALGWYCLLELGVGDETLNHLLFDKEKQSLDLVREPDLFGTWRGRERAFFAETARIVDGLGWERVVHIGGADVAHLAEETRRSFRLIKSGRTPGRLKPSKHKVVHRRDGVVRLKTYSPYHPIELPETVVSALAAFDGRATDEVLRGLQEQGVTIDEPLLRRLLDWEVLQPVGRKERPP
jgi:hypothetical protein